MTTLSVQYEKIDILLLKTTFYSVLLFFEIHNQILGNEQTQHQSRHIQKSLYTDNLKKSNNKLMQQYHASLESIDMKYNA